MYILDQGFKKWAKIACRAGQVLAIVLIWQTTYSPVMGQFGSTVQQFPQVVLNGGSTTSFTIHNPNADKTIDVDVQLYSPAPVEMLDGWKPRTRFQRRPKPSGFRDRCCAR